MAKRKPITVEPESETAIFLRQFDDGPVCIVSEGVRYWIEREVDDLSAGLDPAKVLAAKKKLTSVDVEESKKENREGPPPWGSR